MTKITSSALAFFMLSSLALASDNTPMYDNAYAVKTKEVMMLSQLMKDGQYLGIDVTGWTEGKRGFFSSFSENNDPRWFGEASIRVKINNCFSEEDVQTNKRVGIVLKSRIADGTVVAYREAVKQLKKNGAKYIFVHAVTSDNSLHIDKPFAEYFQSLLTEDYLINEDKRGVSKTTNRILDVWHTMDERCFQDNSFKASDIFWIAGKAAALAIGVKGASIGNTNMTSLAAHSSNAVDNTVNIANSNRPAEDTKAVAAKIAVPLKASTVTDPNAYLGHSFPISEVEDTKTLSGIATNTSISLKASTVADLYYGNSGYSFPISEVEEHLSHYKVIPYNVKKITSD